MEKRFFLALLLTGAVVVVTPLMFPRVKTASPVVAPATPPQSSPRTATSSAGGGDTKTQTPVAASLVSPQPNAAAVLTPGTSIASIETLTVRTTLSRYTFNTLGATPTAIQLDDYQALSGGTGRVVLRHGHEAMLRFRVIAGGDTIALDRTQFAGTQEAAADGSPTLLFTGTSGQSEVAIRYRFSRDDYLATASVQLSNIKTPAFLLVDLPSGFDSQEADSVDDVRKLAYSVKPQLQGAKGIPFTKLEEGESMLQPGPLSWAVAKSKYFLVGVLVPLGGKPFAEARLQGGARTGKLALRGSATIVMPLENGKTSFELYAGPQSWERLHKLGRDFETTNPYGGFLQPVVQPFATIVMRVLLWMKKTVRLDYGWVLVIFGVSVRLLLWPLNQSAMRTSIRMQRIQPELQAIQSKYKSDPQKQQAEIMRVYKEHGMSPFSAFSGCLPMLIPMPVLFALFFVFQNTIEFRGVPFLWLHDISLRDPLYILPLLMGASMYVLSWIGMRNSPPNPQAKMMSYIFPAMMTFVLLNMASGLNLYYAVQNLASLPQQWLIANERAKSSSKS